MITKKKQVSSERLTLDNYIDDLHFDNSPLKRFTFDDYAVKLTTLIKNKIPIINTTINLSSLSKDVLNSLKYCSFKNVIFSGVINSPNLEGPVLKIVISRIVNSTTYSFMRLMMILWGQEIKNQ